MLDELIPYAFGLHAAVTWFLVGLIWFVQVVHYPLMRSVGTGHFREYERAHQRRTTLVVAPAMGIELGLSLALLFITPTTGGRVLAWIGAVLVGLIWASTFLVQVPLHATLSRGFDPTAWRTLVITNGIRTLAWSARGVLALLLLR